MLILKHVRNWSYEIVEREVRAKALVKKVVFEEVHFFSANSTMPSDGCAESEKRVELTRPVEAVELRAMRLKDEKRGMLWVKRVGICRSYGILERNFFQETRVRYKSEENG